MISPPVLRNAFALLTCLAEGNADVNKVIKLKSVLSKVATAMLVAHKDMSVVVLGCAAVSAIVRGGRDLPRAELDGAISAAFLGMATFPASERVQCAAMEAIADVMCSPGSPQVPNSALVAEAFRLLRAFPESRLLHAHTLRILAAAPPQIVFCTEPAARIDAVVGSLNRFVLCAPLAEAACSVFLGLVRKIPELAVRLGQRGGMTAVRRAVAAHPKSSSLQQVCSGVLNGFAEYDILRASFGV